MVRSSTTMAVRLTEIGLWTLEETLTSAVKLFILSLKFSVDGTTETFTPAHTYTHTQ